MVEQFNRPMAEKQAEFDAAIERGLDEEGITDPGTRQQWRNSMTMMATGKGLAAGRQGENPNLNPYMIAGEYTGKPGTANESNSTALGYFQFLRQDSKGNLYSHDQYLPAEYKDNPYDSVGQVRQYIQAITRGRYKGDMMGPIREKNNTGVWGP